MNISQYVAKYDPQNQFDTLINSYKQIEFAWNNKFDLSSLKNINFHSIVVSGLGGSAISADLIKNFLGNEINIPFIVNRNYSLPSFLDRNTLLVISSYSGNTEETVEVLQKALKINCNIICISTGGKVEEIANENDLPLIKVLPGLQPRYALGLSLFSLLKLLQELNLIQNNDSIVKEIISLWKDKGQEYSKENNPAYNYAEQLNGYIPIIYSAADFTSAVGYRIKCQFNENSKLHAFHNVIPELNHNEIIGWESFTDKQLSIKVINIIDQDYHSQIKKRFEITSELISSRNAEIITLESNLSDFKLRIMDLIYLGDWISYYLAIIRGYDPTEIDNINLLKKRLK